MMPGALPSLSSSATATSSTYSVFNAGDKIVGGSDLKPMLYLIIGVLVFLVLRGRM